MTCVRLVAAVAWLVTAAMASGATVSADQLAGIVLPADASATERFAASELQRYVRQMTAVELKVVSEAEDPLGRLLWVGRTAPGRQLAAHLETGLIDAGRETFLLAPAGNGWALAGGCDRATLYAVYELLERNGCRWFFPGELGEIVPRREALVLPDAREELAPAFIQREIDMNAAPGLDAEQVIDWAVKNRLNRIFALRDYQVRRDLPREKWDTWAKRGGYLDWQWIAHNFNWMLPSDKYFADHPEYFALYQGERLAIGSPGRPGYGGGNPCTTNPDVIRICADFASDWFGKHPEGQVVPMWPPDGAVKWCECDACKALGGKNFTSGPEGSMSRRLVTFTNAVAKQVAPDFPRRYILLPAYSNYVEPVAGAAIEPNVLVQYCFHGDYAHAPDASPANAEARRQIEGWAAQAPGRMAMWDYFLIGDLHGTGESPAMLPLAYRSQAMLRYLHGQGFRWYFTQSSSRYWRHNAFVWYATARLAWNPDQDMDALLDDYCRNLYGPAAGAVRDWLASAEKAVQESAWQPKLYADVASPSPLVFSEALLSDGERLLKAAAAERLDDLQRQRLALVRETFEYVKANVRAQAETNLDADTPWRLARGKQAYTLNADGLAITPAKLAEITQYAKDAGIWSAEFERLLFRANRRDVPVEWLTAGTLRAGVLPELGGRLIRLVDAASGRNFMYEPADDLKLDSMGANYAFYGGYEEYVGSQFGGPGWEVAFSRTASGPGTATYRAEFGGWRLERTFTVAGERRLRILSTLTNLTGEQRKTRLRVHPSLSLGPGAGRFTVYLRQADGTIRTSTVEREHDAMAEHAGFWAVVNDRANVGIVNRFDPREASCYLFNGDTHFNLELFGREQELKQGQSLRIAHEYEILTDAAAQLPPLLKAAGK